MYSLYIHIKMQDRQFIQHKPVDQEYPERMLHKVTHIRDMQITVGYPTITIHLEFLPKLNLSEPLQYTFPVL